MTKPLTIEQAIEALKAADEIRGLRCFVITYSDYHALLALLEGLRWRKVGEERLIAEQAAEIERLRAILSRAVKDYQGDEWVPDAEAALAGGDA